MDPAVDDRLHELMEGVNDLLLFIHFDCAEFDDLKRQFFIFTVFSVRTLVPLEVENNIIHGNLRFM